MGSEMCIRDRFYNANNPERPFDATMPIQVSGELAGETELCQTLSAEVGHPVLPLSSPLEGPEYLETSRYIVNSGLILKKLSTKKRSSSLAVNLNLLPAPYQPKPPSLVKIVALPSAVVTVLLSVYLAMLIQGTADSIASAQSQLDVTNQLLQQRQSERQKAVENRSDETESHYARFTAAVHSLNGRCNLINNNLKETVDSLPSYVSLNDISYNDNDNIVTISGIAPSETEVIRYAKNLEESGRFSEIIITAMNRTVDSGMRFSLVFRAGE